MGNGAGAGEVTGARSHTLALVETVESVRGASLNCVGEKTEPIGLDWNTVGAEGTCIVQGGLKSLGAGIAPGHAPSCGCSLGSDTHEGYDEEEEEEGEWWCCHGEELWGYRVVRDIGSS